MIPPESNTDQAEEEYLTLLKAHQIESVDELNSILFEYERSQAYHGGRARSRGEGGGGGGGGGEELVRMAKQYSYS